MSNQFAPDQNEADALLRGLKRVNSFIIKRSVLTIDALSYRVLHAPQFEVDDALATRIHSFCVNVCGPGEYLVVVLHPDNGRFLLLAECDTTMRMPAFGSSPLQRGLGVVLYLPTGGA